MSLLCHIQAPGVQQCTRNLLCSGIFEMKTNAKGLCRLASFQIPPTAKSLKRTIAYSCQAIMNHFIDVRVELPTGTLRTCPKGTKRSNIYKFPHCTCFITCWTEVSRSAYGPSMSDLPLVKLGDQGLRSETSLNAFEPQSWGDTMQNGISAKWNMQRPKVAPNQFVCWWKKKGTLLFDYWKKLC